MRGGVAPLFATSAESLTRAGYIHYGMDVVEAPASTSFPRPTPHPPTPSAGITNLGRLTHSHLALYWTGACHPAAGRGGASRSEQFAPDPRASPAPTH